MNQAIQFPDREWWDESVGAICFPALISGFLLTCAISGETIIRRYGDEPSALASFRMHRWDLEDEAETAIKESKADGQGWIWLS